MKHSQHDKQNESIPFDLNIEHYHVHELENLLKLKKPYDFNDIKTCCQHVQTNLTEDKHLGEDKRNKIFLLS